MCVIVLIAAVIVTAAVAVVQDFVVFDAVAVIAIQEFVIFGAMMLLFFLLLLF